MIVPRPGRRLRHALLKLSRMVLEGQELLGRLGRSWLLPHPGHRIRLLQHVSMMGWGGEARKGQRHVRPAAGIMYVCSAACPTVLCTPESALPPAPTCATVQRCNACAVLTDLQVRRCAQPWRHCGGAPRVCKMKAALHQVVAHSPKLPRQCCMTRAAQFFTAPHLSSLLIPTWQLAHDEVPYLPPMPARLHADSGCHVAPSTAEQAAGNSAGVCAHQQLPLIPVSVLRRFHCSNVSHTCLPSCSPHLLPFFNPACNLLIGTPSPSYAPCITPAG